MTDTKTIQQIDQEITEFLDLQNNIKTWFSEYEKESKIKDNDFTLEIIKENPEWVKERRMEFLQTKEKDLNEKYINFYDTAFKATDFKDNNHWFMELVNDYIKQPLKEIVKEIKRIKFEIDCLNQPALIVGSGGVTPEEVNMAREVSCEHFIEIKRSVGDKRLALCPFHPDTIPSLTIYPAGKGYHCFACGAHGDIIDFVMKTQNLDFISAVKLILQNS